MEEGTSDELPDIEPAAVPTARRRILQQPSPPPVRGAPYTEYINLVDDSDLEKDDEQLEVGLAIARSLSSAEQEER